MNPTSFSRYLRRRRCFLCVSIMDFCRRISDGFFWRSITRSNSQTLWEELILMADIVTPNQKEASALLGGVQLETLDDMRFTVKSIHEFGPRLDSSCPCMQAMQIDKISGKFHHITEDIEDALGHIPYDKLDISEEVQEQIELVHAQFRRALTKIDLPDLQLEIDLAMSQREKDPDPLIFERLSEKLHLKTINDLKKESLSIHDMVVSSEGIPECFEAMSYILRKIKDCVLVGNPDDDEAANSEKTLIKHRSHIIPDDFRCPISLELMKDPVIVSTGQPDKTSGTIKEQLAAIAPVLENLWAQKEEKRKEFFDVQSQIQKKSSEISGNTDQLENLIVDETDLSLKKLEEFHAQLQDLQKEKSERLHKVLEFVSTLHDLCVVLEMDFVSTITEVHPSLNDTTGVQSKSISNGTLSRLAKTVSTLKEDKKQRLQKLQELATQLTDHWNLMDTPEDERSLFDHITCNISALVDEVTIPDALTLDVIEQVEVEVERLDRLKFSKMKEIAFKRQAELEEIFALAHIEIFALAHIEIDTEAAREKILSLINSGNIEPTELLADMDHQSERRGPKRKIHRVMKFL